MYSPRASAHRGKWGQLTPSPLEKNDEKLKGENKQKSSFLNVGGGEVIGVIVYVIF